MTETAFQIPLSLSSKNPFDRRYFVFHSGVAQSYTLLFIQGMRGVGKTHFIEIAKQHATDLGVEKIVVYENLTPQECESIEWCRAFVSDYQSVIQSGAVLFVSSTSFAEQLCQEPGARSRLVAAEQLVLGNPEEEEMLPIIHSIAERRNLVLSDRKIDYIIRRLPRNPLSFENLFDTIDQLCLTSGKSAGLQMIRSVIDNSDQSSKVC